MDIYPFFFQGCRAPLSLAKHALLLTIGLCIGSLAHAFIAGTISANPTYTSMAYAQVDKLWLAFRERFPFHIQTIGEAAIQADSSCVLIISEPPPHVTEEAVNNLLSPYPHILTVKKQPINYDGWVKDIVMVVAGIDPIMLEKIKKDLSEYLFFTNYGVVSLQLKADFQSVYQAALEHPVNFQLSPSELESWFCGPEAITFEQNTIPQLLASYSSQSSRLYYSRKRGFVLWLIPKKVNLQNEKANIRRFALDIDLILGAIEKNGKVAIVGRERQLSVFDLPPLRTETILTLAAADSLQLAQSYERNNIMAGKTKIGKDWAPIFLSDELLNTEYGNLLNITDQLLKSWSQNGETVYEEFDYEYPATNWGFKESVYKLVNKQFKNSALTFNWNTSGAVYEIVRTNYNVIGLNSTGSLPVSYIPDDQSTSFKTAFSKIEPYEQAGYKFFSNCLDANLVRAAQYAALYQIFKAHNINSTSLPVSGFNTFRPLEAMAVEFMNRIKRLNAAQADSLVNQVLMELLVNEFAKNKIEITDEQLDEVIKNNPSLLETDKRKMLNDFATLQKAFKLLDQKDVNKPLIIKMLVNRNAIRSMNRSSFDRISFSMYRVIEKLLQDVRYIKYDVSLIGMNADSLIDEMVHYNQNSPARWIKTPSVVVSLNQEPKVMYGGHNIYAKTLKVGLDKKIPRGYYAMRNGLVRINPEDEALLNSIVLRKLGVQSRDRSMGSSPVLHKLSVGEEPPRPPRKPDVIITEEELPANQRGFIAGCHDVLTVKRQANNSFVAQGKTINSCKQLHALLLKHTENNPGIAIEFVDFTEEAVAVRLKGVQVQLNIEKNMDGVFRPLAPGEKMMFRASAEGSGINSELYIFDGIPVEKKASTGNLAIGVELPARDHSHIAYMQAQAKSPSLFEKVKSAFLKAFNFAKSGKVDLGRKIYQELLDVGLRKADFSLILSNTADCVVCKKDQEANESMVQVQKKAHGHTSQ